VKLSRAQQKAMGVPVPTKPRKSWGGKGVAKKVAYVGNQIFDAACVAHGLPVPVHEYEFWPGRKWRFDYCWPEHELAVEQDGGASRASPVPRAGSGQAAATTEGPGGSRTWRS